MATRTRERVVDAAGRERVQTKPPRADVLHYPAHDLVTVLVRRTHDVTAARLLADERWAQLLNDGLVEGYLGATERCVRVGWWTTRGGRQRSRDQAVDEHGRLITACLDTDAGAGPGVEFRP